MARHDLRLSWRAMRRLKQLARKKRTSKDDLTRRALALYDLCDEEIEAGYQITLSNVCTGEILKEIILYRSQLQGC